MPKKSYEEKMDELAQRKKKIQEELKKKTLRLKTESAERTKQIQEEERRLRARHSQEERKQRTKHLIEAGAAVYSVLGREFHDGDIDRLIAFLKAQEQRGNFFSRAMNSE